MPKVSVIIPCYNVEKYLGKCLESILNQTYSNLEIICVNDGSTDSTLALLEEYSQKDERIRIINQQNQGVSAARNSGLEVATGSYIIFVDSDDFIKLNTCELAMGRILKTDADICCFGTNEISKGLSKERLWERECFERYSDKELDDSARKHLLVNVCGKLYKKAFLIENEIKFIRNIKTGEDSIFNLFCLFKNAKFVLLNEFLYDYNVDIGSSATNNLEKAVLNDIYGYKAFFATSVFKNAQNSLKVIALEKFIGQLSWWYLIQGRKCSSIYYPQIVQFQKYLYANFPNEILKNVSNMDFINSFDAKTYTD